MMRKINNMFACVLILVFSAFSVQANQDPLVKTKAMIDALKNVTKNDEKTYIVVDQYIDYDRLTKQTIAPHRTQFSDKQAAEFIKLFRSLIRMIAYPQSSSFYEDAKLIFNEPVIEENLVLVNSEANIEKEDFEMEIAYQWTKNSENWLLSDLLIDEDSLVKDYQNQFGRIIKKDGVNMLIQKVKDKIAEVEKEKK